MLFKMIKNVEKSFAFLKYANISENHAKFIKDIIQILPNDIIDFSFIRIRPNGDCNSIISDASRAITYVKEEIWVSDVTMNVDFSPPIYNRQKFFLDEQAHKYLKHINRFGGVSTISISYRFSRCKDVFIFILNRELSNEEQSALFPLLHSIASLFYSKEIIFTSFMRLPEIFYKKYLYHDIKYNFAPFTDLTNKYKLRESQINYLLQLAIGMSTKTMSDLFGRSTRTVEKRIDSIRFAFNIDTKKELSKYLYAYYLASVQLWQLKGKSVEIESPN